MAKQTGEVKLEGTIGNICFYKIGDEWYARLKSSLTGKRVKKDPRFRRTMEYAGMLAQASRLASCCYSGLLKEERVYAMYREMVGIAMGMLKAGKDVAEIGVRLGGMDWKKEAVEIAVAAEIVEIPQTIATAKLPGAKASAKMLLQASSSSQPRLYVDHTGQLVEGIHINWSTLPSVIFDST